VEKTLYSVESPIYVITLMVGSGSREAGLQGLTGGRFHVPVLYWGQD
jgi:hypothetical protein